MASLLSPIKSAAGSVLANQERRRTTEHVHQNIPLPQSRLPQITASLRSVTGDHHYGFPSQTRATKRNSSLSSPALAWKRRRRRSSLHYIECGKVLFNTNYLGPLTIEILRLACEVVSSSAVNGFTVESEPHLITREEIRSMQLLENDRHSLTQINYSALLSNAQSISSNTEGKENVPELITMRNAVTSCPSNQPGAGSHETPLKISTGHADDKRRSLSFQIFEQSLSPDCRRQTSSFSQRRYSYLELFEEDYGTRNKEKDQFKDLSVCEERNTPFATDNVTMEPRSVSEISEYDDVTNVGKKGFDSTAYEEDAEINLESGRDASRLTMPTRDPASSLRESLSPVDKLAHGELSDVLDAPPSSVSNQQGSRVGDEMLGESIGFNPELSSGLVHRTSNFDSWKTKPVVTLKDEAPDGNVDLVTDQLDCGSFDDSHCYSDRINPEPNSVVVPNETDSTSLSKVPGLWSQKKRATSNVPFAWECGPRVSIFKSGMKCSDHIESTSGLKANMISHVIKQCTPHVKSPRGARSLKKHNWANIAPDLVGKSNEFLFMIMKNLENYVHHRGGEEIMIDDVTSYMKILKTTNPSDPRETEKRNIGYLARRTLPLELLYEVDDHTQLR